MISASERKKRLAYAHRIIAMLGLDDHTYTHLTHRAINSDQFYIQPFGDKFAESHAETLLTVSVEGKVISGTERIYNPTAYQTHGPLYQSRPDLQAIFHLHTPHMVAVSCLDSGLMPISQWALHFYEQVAYHDYDSLITAADQGQKLVHDLGNKNILFLRHHGVIIAGKTIQEAMFYTHHLELACKTQVLALSMQQPLKTLDHKTCRRAVETLLNFEQDLGARDWAAWVKQYHHTQAVESEAF
jgi:ribulose-5-phosphate 4-epimerase/fuculose-1-phosphate aldolase